MEVLLIKSAACLAIFMVFYKLVLENKPYHHLKRYYLLGALFLSIVIPLFTFTEYVVVARDTTSSSLFANTVPIASSNLEAFPEEPVNYGAIVLWSIYSIGFLIFATKFFINLKSLYTRIYRNERRKTANVIHVLLKDLLPPHTFFNYIFLNKSKFENNDIPKEVLLHEETHAKQKHSIDILFIEFLQVVFWFNPLFYLIKKDIKLNHEFLADAAVLKKGVSPKSYQHILLQFSSKEHDFQLANAINYSSIKKRFTLMKTQTSKQKTWLVSLLIVPLIAGLVYGFSTTETVEVYENPELETSILAQSVSNSENGATQEMMQEYDEWMNWFNSDSSSLFIPVGTVERLVAIYDLMSEEQRHSVEAHPFLQEISSDLYSVEPNRPTAVQFESWKNEKEFAIWLDRKHISNSELNNFTIQNIAYYVDYSDNSNAQRKKFPQPFQINLYTKKGFDKFYKEAFVRDYKELIKTYSKGINTYLKGSQIDNSEFRIIKAQADKFYDSFTDEERKKYNILMPPPVPAEYKNPRNSEQQQGATKKQIAEYNAWAKKINETIKKADSDQNGEYPIIKLKDIKRYKNIYNKVMTDSQRGNAEPWPNIPPLPPPPAPKAKKSDGHIPPPPPPPKQNVEIKEVEVPAPPPPPIPKTIVEQYAKEHPKSVSKTKINGEILEIVEMPMDEISYKGKTYNYHLKNDKSGYVFFDETNHILDEQLINTLTKLVKERN